MWYPEPGADAHVSGGPAEPVQDVHVSSPDIERAVDLARRGVITHLTVHGERVTAIVPESVIDGLVADPRPAGVVSLTGHRPYPPVRSGDYRDPIEFTTRNTSAAPVPASACRISGRLPPVIASWT